MKPLKPLGVAVVAALTAMAIVGLPSAMAESTALCSADESSCAAGHLVTHVHETTLAGSPAIILNSVGNVLCNTLFLSTSVGALGAPQIIKGNFTYSGCLRHKSGGSTENCTVTEQNGPAELKVLKVGHETATVVYELEVRVKCGFFIDCTYNGENQEGLVKGPLLSSETNGSILFDNQTMHVVRGTFCPAKAELDSTTQPLSATYVSA